jgi:hypothetical protein
MATTTDGRVKRARRWRPSRRALAGGLAALVLATATWTAVSWGEDDDRPVDPTTPEARRAAAVALDVVPGRVVGVARDEDNGKWEIAVLQEGREYEVELSHPSLTLLRIDYQTD